MLHGGPTLYVGIVTMALILTVNGLSFIVCENEKKLLKCDCRKLIHVLSANYGRTHYEPCTHESRSNLKCFYNVTQEVSTMCSSRPSCQIAPTNDLYYDACGGTYKYIEIQYQCLDSQEMHLDYDSSNNVAIPEVETPAIVCPNNSVECGDILLNVASVTWEPIYVEDYFGRQLETTQSSDNGSLFTIGETLVNATTNVVGCDDHATCSFKVIVTDCISLDDCEFVNMTVDCLLSYSKQQSSVNIYTEYDIANSAADVDRAIQTSQKITNLDPMEISHSHLKGFIAFLDVDMSTNYSQSITFSNITVKLRFNYTGQITLIAVYWEYDFIRTPKLSDAITEYEEYYLNSGLLSITTYAEDDIVIISDVEYKMQILENDENIKSLTSMDYNITSVCGFIDLETQKWSTTGCYVADINITWAVCRCDHLTSFGVLMQVSSYEADDIHAEALSILTKIGLILSIVLLILTETVYFVFKGLWKSLRNNIHKNLIGNMIIFYILFIIGIDKTGSTAFCRVVAIVLHLLLMNIFTWTLAEAIFLVFKVIYRTPSPHNRLRNYIIICYTSSIIIVFPIVIAKSDSYGNNVCWLDRNLIWAIVVPALTIVLFSMVVLVFMVRIIYQRAGTNKQSQDQEKHKQLKKSLKGALILIPILGVTWIFGPFTINEETLFMQYIFVILNCFQGVFVFFAYCLFDNEIQTHWKNAWRRHSKVHSNETAQTSITGVTESKTRTSHL